MVAVLAACAVSASPAAGQVADDGIHRLVLYISEPSMDKMNSVLDVAANVSRHYSEIGEEVEIEVVAFNRGLHMLRADTSPVKKRLTNFMQSMINVTFQACGNTIDTVTRNEGEAPPLMVSSMTLALRMSAMCCRLSFCGALIQRSRSLAMNSMS